jgi:splicing factor 3B subunit 4
VNVYIPKDKVTNQHNNYGFVEFRSEDDAEYAIKMMNMVKLYGKPLRVNRVRAFFSSPPVHYDSDLTF